MPRLSKARNHEPRYPMSDAQPLYQPRVSTPKLQEQNQTAQTTKITSSAQSQPPTLPVHIIMYQMKGLSASPQKKEKKKTNACGVKNAIMPRVANITQNPILNIHSRNIVNAIYSVNTRGRSFDFLIIRNASSTLSVT